MSRIGKLPVKIPAGVKASVADNTVSIEGAKGKLSQKFGTAVNIKLENDEIHGIGAQHHLLGGGDVDCLHYSAIF